MSISYIYCILAQKLSSIKVCKHYSCESHIPSPKTKQKLTSPRHWVIFFSSCLFFFCWFESWCESTYNYSESKSVASSWVLQVSIHSYCRKYRWLNMYSVHFSIFRIMQSHFVHFKQRSQKRDKSPQLFITHYLMLQSY